MSAEAEEIDSQGIVVGIDASNLRQGGGLTHLAEVLTHLRPRSHNIAKVIVWCGSATADRIPSRSWLVKVREPSLDGSAWQRAWWRRYVLPQKIDERCDMLFVPGGIYAGQFKPFVTMSRNLLPFSRDERRKFGLSWNRLRYRLLAWSQSRTFEKANGLIFLTRTAQQEVEVYVGKSYGEKATVIPHGINLRFQRAPRPQKPLQAYSWERPFQWIYVSTVNYYKHPWNVVEGIAALRKQGLPVAVDLIGHAYRPALGRLNEVLERVDPQRSFARYLGPVDYQSLDAHYAQADGFVFASSCETFGQVLTEAMLSGLPIACANRSAMPEILGDGGVYFDPESPSSIAEGLRRLMEDESLRDACARMAYERSQTYSWERCASETFSFIADVARSFHAGPS